MNRISPNSVLFFAICLASVALMLPTTLFALRLEFFPHTSPSLLWQQAPLLALIQALAILLIVGVPAYLLLQRRFLWEWVFLFVTLAALATLGSVWLFRFWPWIKPDPLLNPTVWMFNSIAMGLLLGSTFLATAAEYSIRGRHWVTLGLVITGYLGTGLGAFWLTSVALYFE